MLLDTQAPPWCPNNLMNRLKFYELQLGDPNPNPVVDVVGRRVQYTEKLGPRDLLMNQKLNRTIGASGPELAEAPYGSTPVEPSVPLETPCARRRVGTPRAVEGPQRRGPEQAQSVHPSEGWARDHWRQAPGSPYPYGHHGLRVEEQVRLPLGPWVQVCQLVCIRRILRVWLGMCRGEPGGGLGVVQGLGLGS